LLAESKINPATAEPKITAATTTQIIVFIWFLRFQSALPKEFFGICGLKALPSPPFWQFNYCFVASSTSRSIVHTSFVSLTPTAGMQASVL
jgi:hypothetical protein